MRLVVYSEAAATMIGARAVVGVEMAVVAFVISAVVGMVPMHLIIVISHRRVVPIVVTLKVKGPLILQIQSLQIIPDFPCTKTDDLHRKLICFFRRNSAYGLITTTISVVVLFLCLPSIMRRIMQAAQMLLLLPISHQRDINKKTKTRHKNQKVNQVRSQALKEDGGVPVSVITVVIGSIAVVRQRRDGHL